MVHLKKTKTALQSELLRRPESLRESLERVVAETAFDIEADVKAKMRAPKHGRTYKRGHVTRKASRNTRALGLREVTSSKGFQRAVVGYNFHRASAPGEAPAVDQSTLINSIKTVPSGTRATVTASAPQAEALEFKRGRAVFGPALERARPQFQRDADEAVRKLC